MTTLTSPSFERLLLRTVSEGVAAEPVGTWPPQTLQLGLDIVQTLRTNSTQTRHQLEQLLADGVEARSFVRDCSPLLALTDERLAKTREAVELLSAAEDTASARLLAELRLLEQEDRAFRDLLSRALSRASEAPRPVDWERVRAAEEAYARGETKPFPRR
jgi:hypothetical protein